MQITTNFKSIKNESSGIIRSSSLVLKQRRNGNRGRINVNSGVPNSNSYQALSPVQKFQYQTLLNSSSSKVIFPRKLASLLESGALLKDAPTGETVLAHLARLALK